MVDEYRRYYGPWGFDLATIQQPITIWQGEEDTVLPTKCARRLRAYSQITVSCIGILLQLQVLCGIRPRPSSQIR